MCENDFDACQLIVTRSQVTKGQHLRVSPGTTNRAAHGSKQSCSSLFKLISSARHAQSSNYPSSLRSVLSSSMSAVGWEVEAAAAGETGPNRTKSNIH